MADAPAPGGTAAAAAPGLSRTSLQDVTVDPRLWELVPRAWAVEHRAVPIMRIGGQLQLAVADAGIDLSGLDVELRLHLADPAELDAVLAGSLELVTLDPQRPDHRPVNPLAAGLLPEDACREHSMLGIAYAAGVLTVATATPQDAGLARLVRELTGRPAELVVAPAPEIAAAIDRTFGAAVTPEDVGALLVARGQAGEAEVAAARDQAATSGTPLADVLVAEGVVSEPALVAVLAEQLQLPLVDLSHYDPEPEALAVIPARVARRLRCVPLAVDPTTLYLVVAGPLDDEATAALRQHTDLALRPFLAGRTAIDELLQRVRVRADATAGAPALLQPGPEGSDGHQLSGVQQAALVLVGVAAVVLLVLFPLVTVVVLLVLAAALALLLHRRTRPGVLLATARFALVRTDPERAT